MPLLLVDFAIIELSRRRGHVLSQRLEIPRTGTPVQVRRRAGREDGLVVPEDVQPEREPHARPVERRARRAGTGATRREQRALCHLGLGLRCGRGGGGGGVGGRGEPVEEDRARGVARGGHDDREVGGEGSGGSGDVGRGGGVGDGAGGARTPAHVGGEAEAEG